MTDKLSSGHEGFIELAEHSADVDDPSIVVRRVTRVPNEGGCRRLGDLLRIDTSKRDLKYGAEFSVRIGGREVLARLRPTDGRPKDGPRELCLEPSWSSDVAAIPVTPDEFEQICVGRLDTSHGNRAGQ